MRLTAGAFIRGSILSLGVLGVLETARHLEALGIHDRYLSELVAALGGTDLPVIESA